MTIITFLRQWERGVGNGWVRQKQVDETDVNAEGKPSVFIQGSFCDISGEKDHQYQKEFNV